MEMEKREENASEEIEDMSESISVNISFSGGRKLNKTIEKRRRCYDKKTVVVCVLQETNTFSSYHGQVEWLPVFGPEHSQQRRLRHGRAGHRTVHACGKVRLLGHLESLGGVWGEKTSRQCFGTTATPFKGPPHTHTQKC